MCEGNYVRLAQHMHMWRMLRVGTHSLSSTSSFSALPLFAGAGENLSLQTDPWRSGGPSLFSDLCEHPFWPSGIPQHFRQVPCLDSKAGWYRLGLGMIARIYTTFAHTRNHHCANNFKKKLFDSMPAGDRIVVMPRGDVTGQCSEPYREELTWQVASIVDASVHADKSLQVGFVLHVGVMQTGVQHDDGEGQDVTGVCASHTKQNNTKVTCWFVCTVCSICSSIFALLIKPIGCWLPPNDKTYESHVSHRSTG